MEKAGSLKAYIERLSALPPQERLEAWRAIPDEELRDQVARALPGKVHAEMLAQELGENLNRNVLAKKTRKDRAA